MSFVFNIILVFQWNWSFGVFLANAQKNDPAKIDIVTIKITFWKKGGTLKTSNKIISFYDRRDRYLYCRYFRNIFIC